MLFMQDFNKVQLIAVIEKQHPDHLEFVDKVCIPIAMNNFSKSEEYYGMHGIARITLGYMFIFTSQDNIDAAHQGQ